MPARRKTSKARRPEPGVVADPWTPWIDIAVSFGHAVIAYEMMLADAALAAPRRAQERSRLRLAYSSATIVAPSPPACRPRLRSVRAAAADEDDDGKV